ncbi:MAG: response regulator [Thermodesulfobacteriota bacterium]
MNILVVDDEGIVLESCNRVLRPEGFSVQLAASADEALAIIEGQPPALLIIDVKMPVHDGLYIMKELNRRQLRVPVILMSGFSTRETIEESYKMGAMMFLAKPFTPDELLGAVRRVIEEASDEKEKSPGH